MRGKVKLGWRKPHNEGLHNLTPFTKYYYGEEIRKGKMGWPCSMNV